MIIARRVAFSVYKFVFCVPEKKTPSKICPSTRRPCAQLWREKKLTFDIGCVRRRRLRRSLLGEYLSSSSFMNRSFCLLRSDRRRIFLFPLFQEHRKPRSGSLFLFRADGPTPLYRTPEEEQNWNFFLVASQQRSLPVEKHSRGRGIPSVLSGASFCLFGAGCVAQLLCGHWHS